MKQKHKTWAGSGGAKNAATVSVNICLSQVSLSEKTNPSRIQWLLVDPRPWPPRGGRGGRWGVGGIFLQGSMQNQVWQQLLPFRCTVGPGGFNITASKSFKSGRNSPREENVQLPAPKSIVWSMWAAKSRNVNVPQINKPLFNQKYVSGPLCDSRTGRWAIVILRPSCLLLYVLCSSFASLPPLCSISPTSSSSPVFS